MSGKLTVIVGSMNSGKTEILLRMANEHKHSFCRQAFRPRIDTRGDMTLIQSRAGLSIPARNVSDGADLLSAVGEVTEVVYIDEAQFINGIYAAVRELQDSGTDVVVSALSSDYRNRPFGEIGELLAVADSIIHVPATCSVCGATGTRTHRTIDSNDLIVIGGDESYESRCHECWEK